MLNVLIMVGILALFYATDQKPLAMRLMRTLNPLSSLLPWITQGMRLNYVTVRLYDFLAVLTMAIQGFAIGSLIDLARWLRQRKIAAN